MRPLLSTVPVLAFLLACVSPAGATDRAAFLAARDTLRRGVDEARAATVLEARAAFEALAETEPDSLALQLWIATCDWRAVPLARRGGGTNRVAAAICDHGLAAAERVLKRTPHDPEAMALEAALLGLSLRFLDPSATMTVGPQLVALFAAARAAAPDAPRVLLLDALNTLYVPEFYGGGAGKAMPRFEHAIAAFQRDSTTSTLALDWGAADARLWAGQTAARLGDRTRAREYYQQALALDPDYGWVRDELLPALDRLDSTAVDTTVRR